MGRRKTPQPLRGLSLSQQFCSFTFLNLFIPSLRNFRLSVLFSILFNGPGVLFPLRVCKFTEGRVQASSCVNSTALIT